jgi:hypothetical protein
MVKTTGFILFVLTFGILACNPPTDKQEVTAGSSIAADSFPVDENAIPLGAEDPKRECVRGAAEPLVNKKYLPNSTFTLQPDSLTGIETVIFDNGDKLTITNHGCEYYALTFRFETSEYTRDSTLAYWFEAAGDLMTKLIAAIDPPIDIKKGVAYLESYVLRDAKNKFRNVKLNDEIDFGGKPVREFLTVNSIEKITDKKYAVELSFYKGPL